MIPCTSPETTGARPLAPRAGSRSGRMIAGTLPVPAGYAKPAGSPDAPLILLLVGLLMASGGAVAWKFRGKHVG